ncbi:hypothetical protein WJX72_009299 [[Myrmecia] bisecta]|uniref:Uncharacterized protein n=1 Tax=[Myrmecia] bisecta TaxID=41462 RepID=A0AAW1QRU5_9CHLO
MARARYQNRDKKPSRWPELLLHLVLLAGFLAVWSWHMTPAANKQQVAKKTFWFWNYLTFISFSWQLLAFSIALLADLTGSKGLRAASDDVMCSTCGPVIFVTICYYILLAMGAIVDSDEVPKWVSPVLHTGNSIALGLDSLLCRRERSFSRRAEVYAAGLLIGYVGICYLSKQHNGDFPYSFMNEMPEPWGLVAMAAVLPTASEAIFLVGRKLQTGSFGAPVATKSHRS